MEDTGRNIWARKQLLVKSEKESEFRKKGFSKA
jgi:hypothetical protein